MQSEFATQPDQTSRTKKHPKSNVWLTNQWIINMPKSRVLNCVASFANSLEFIAWSWHCLMSNAWASFNRLCSGTTLLHQAQQHIAPLVQQHCGTTSQDNHHLGKSQCKVHVLLNNNNHGTMKSVFHVSTMMSLQSSLQWSLLDNCRKSIHTSSSIMPSTPWLAAVSCYVQWGVKAKI